MSLVASLTEKFRPKMTEEFLRKLGEQHAGRTGAELQVRKLSKGGEYWPKTKNARMVQTCHF